MEWRLQPGPFNSVRMEMTELDASAKRKIEHHPPHVYLDDTWYIITAGTFDRGALLSNEQAKELLRDTLKTLALEFRITLRAWVILDNYYHLLLRTSRGKDLSHFIGRLHGSTARQINLWDQVTARQVWHNYWDTCIRTEADYWTRFNYIHNNPVKHGYVSKWEDWPFSSYGYYLRTKGEEWLLDRWRRYPVIDYLEGDDSDAG
jgi:putative transposase